MQNKIAVVIHLILIIITQYFSIKTKQIQKIYQKRGINISCNTFHT